MLRTFHWYYVTILADALRDYADYDARWVSAGAGQSNDYFCLLKPPDGFATALFSAFRFIAISFHAIGASLRA